MYESQVIPNDIKNKLLMEQLEAENLEMKVEKERKKQRQVVLIFFTQNKVEKIITIVQKTTHTSSILSPYSLS